MILKIIPFFLTAIFILSNEKTNGQTDDNSTKGTAPVFISSDYMSKELYVGIPNRIKIHCASSQADHIKLSCSSCKITALDTSKEIYNIEVDRPGMAIEILAVDTLNNIKYADVFLSKKIPDPSLIFTEGTKRKKIKNSHLAETFRKFDGFFLQYELPLYSICAVTKFNLWKIDANGQQSRVENNIENKFDTQTLELMQSAQKGDAFIFHDIECNCSDDFLKNISIFIN